MTRGQPASRNAAEKAGKARRRYWLMKSEPDVYGIDHLAAEGEAPWDGVRNYTARNHMRSMGVGDLVLFYHSNAKPPGVAGVARVSREAYPDHTQFDRKSPYFDPKSSKDAPRWEMVDVAFVEKLPRFVPLDELKTDDALEGMAVRQKGQRLSVQPVTAEHFRRVLRLGQAATRLT